MYCIGIMPFLIGTGLVGVDFTATAGNVFNYFGVALWGAAVLPLALRKTDAFRIFIGCLFFFGLGLFFALLFTFAGIFSYFSAFDPVLLSIFWPSPSSVARLPPSLHPPSSASRATASRAPQCRHVAGSCGFGL